jgi:hypothetical protein
LIASWTHNSTASFSARPTGTLLLSPWVHHSILLGVHVRVLEVPAPWTQQRSDIWLSTQRRATIPSLFFVMGANMWQTCGLIIHIKGSIATNMVEAVLVVVVVLVSLALVVQVDSGGGCGGDGSGGGSDGGTGV